MTTQHRYQLQPYRSQSSRYDCPQCGGRKKFKRYIDTQTNQHLAHHVGKCDRLDNCGYHFTPKQYFAHNPDAKPQPHNSLFTPPPIAQMSTIPEALFKATLRRYMDNNFVRYLLTLFEEETVYRLIKTYHIGTSKRWTGACIFWQVDNQQRVRTGKIMLYNPATGKRVKQPYAHVAWVHNTLRLHNQNSDPDNYRGENPKSEFILRQCFYGEHLLKENENALVAIVESEKTAIIAAGFMPEHCWLAAGSLQGLTVSKCKALQGRKVMLFPDSDGITAWQQRLQQLRQQLPGIRWGMASYANGDAPGAGFGGVDIADWLVGR